MPPPRRARRGRARARRSALGLRIREVAFACRGRGRSWGVFARGSSRRLTDHFDAGLLYWLLGCESGRLGLDRPRGSVWDQGARGRAPFRSRSGGASPSPLPPVSAGAERNLGGLAHGWQIALRGFAVFRLQSLPAGKGSVTACCGGGSADGRGGGQASSRNAFITRLTAGLGEDKRIDLVVGKSAARVEAPAV